MPITSFPSFCFSTLLLVLAGFSTPESRAVAQPFKVEVQWSPPEGGTVTGAGDFEPNQTSDVVMKASDGWYIHDVTASPAGFEDVLRNEFLMGRTIEFMHNKDGLVEELTHPVTHLDGSVSISVKFRRKAEAVPVLKAPGISTASIGMEVTSYAARLGEWISFYGGDVAGARPMTFEWLKDGVPIPGASGSGIPQYYIPELEFGDAGRYTYRLSNLYGTTESAAVEIVFPTSFKAYAFVGAQWIDAGSSVAFVGGTTIRFETSITPALIFYTLDGSEPSITSELYSEPFFLTNSCTLRAIAYKPDLSTSLTLPEIAITKGVEGILEIPPFIGGWAGAESAPPYVVGQRLKIMQGVNDAFPGAKFMGWMGSVVSTEPILNLTVEPHTILQPIFGVSATVAVVGSGDILGLKSGDVVPLGSPVSLQALPKASFRFTQWGGMASGTNPQTTLTNNSPNLVVTALFSPLPENEVTLSVRTEGVGVVRVEPLQASYPKGTTVTVTAAPGLHQTLVRWEGAATGNDATVRLTLNESMSVKAIFSSNLVLGTRFQPVPFAELSVRLPVAGGLNRACRLEQSHDLASWGNPFRLPALPFPVEPSRWYRSENAFFRIVGE